MTLCAHEWGYPSHSLSHEWGYPSHSLSHTWGSPLIPSLVNGDTHLRPVTLRTRNRVS